jgi:hypothetical protein
MGAELPLTPGRRHSAARLDGYGPFGIELDQCTHDETASCRVTMRAGVPGGSVARCRV